MPAGGKPYKLTEKGRNSINIPLRTNATPRRRRLMSVLRTIARSKKAELTAEGINRKVTALRLVDVNSLIAEAWNKGLVRVA